jgi:2,5-diketo-D-gluconate reductase A
MLVLERPANDRASLRGQWAACEDAVAAGSARRLGVCNFGLDELDVLLEGGVRLRPQMNQLQYTLAIRMPHAALLAEHCARGVQLMAFSPLGGPDGLLPRSIRDQCAAIGRAHPKGGQPRSWQQVALRWLAQQRVPYAVHSATPRHLAEDLDVFDFALTDDEMRALEAASEAPPAYW